MDKANTWSNINTSQREICISGDRDAYIAPMWEGASSGIAFLNSDATKTFVFGQYTTDANNRKVIDSTKGRLLIRAGERNGETVLDFEPRATNAILGTSTNPFKTLNGINPGALSLPSETASSVNLDPTNWNISGTIANRYTPPADGWLGVQVMSKDTADLTGQYLFVGRATGGSDYYPEGGTTSITVNYGQGTLMGQVFIPVISGKEYHIRVKIGVDLTHGSSITARFYTCQGNV